MANSKSNNTKKISSNDSIAQSMNSKKLDSDQVYKQLVTAMMRIFGNSTVSLKDRMAEKAKDLDENFVQKSTPVQTTLRDSYGGVNGYGNTITYSGSDDKIASFTNYGFDNDTMNYPLWTVLYNDSWVFRRAIDKPANDEINSGIIIKSGNDMTDVYDMYNRYKPDLINLFKWGALYGGAIATMMFDGLEDSDYAKPLNPSQIKGKTMKLYVTDRWYGASIIGTDTVTDMTDIDFGKPMYYNVTYANGVTVRVHHSFVIRYEHRGAPMLIKNGMLQGWGYAEGAHILNELSRDDQLKASIQNLVNKALIEVIKMPGMRGVFMGADQGQMNQLTKRLEMVEWARNYNSLTFLDSEDEYQQNSFTGLQGLADILEDNLWMIGAALEMQGILYGDLKGGLSQNSDAMKRYHYTIHGRCEEFGRYPVTKLLSVIYIMCGKDEAVDFEFGHFALNDINKDKNAGITAFASTLQQLTRNKWISDYRAVVSLKTYCETGNMNISFSEEYIKQLEIEEKEQILSAMKKPGRDSGDKKPSEGGAPMEGDTSAMEELFGSPEEAGGTKENAPVGEEPMAESEAPVEEAPSDTGLEEVPEGLFEE